MPEYLSPGVYVEEVPTGSKPIEGVSTSTAGMVGVTERGPENIPTLVTSIGEFNRIFGNDLDFTEFNNDGRVHAYLPHAVEGFFTNGGRRVYVVRVSMDDATRAARLLFDRGAPGSATTILLRNIPRGRGSALNLPLLQALDVTNLAVNDWVRIGDGSRAEYRQIASVGANPVHVVLNFPLGIAHNAGITVDEVPRQVDTTNYTTGDFVFAADAAAGSMTITVSAGATANDLVTLLGLPGDSLFEIGDAASAEYIRVTAATDLGGGQVRLGLATELFRNYSTGDIVNAIEIPAAAVTANLSLDTSAGDMLIYLDNLVGGFTNTANLAVIDNGNPDAEVRRIGDLSSLSLDLGAYTDYSLRSIVELVTLADDDRQVAAAAGPPNTATAFDVDRVDGLAIGMQIDVGGDPGVIDSIDIPNSRVTLQAALPAVPADGTIITLTPKQLTSAADAGRIVVSLNNRLGLNIDDVLRIGTAPNEEYVTIAEVSGERNVAPDPGTVVLNSPLQQTHANGTQIRRQHPPTVNTARQPAITLFLAQENSDSLIVNDGSNYAANEILRITLPAGTEYYHRLESNVIDLDPREVELTAAVDLSHEAGSPLIERAGLVQVQALDRGGWGNRLLVAVDDEESGLASRAELTEINPPLELRLTTVTGIESGTILELLDPITGNTIGPLLKVRAVDRAANNLITLDAPGLQAVHIGAHNAALLAGNQLHVRSREFNLTIFLLQRPHPAIPSRNDQLLDSEVFRHLSMDPRHSRYIHRIIGTTWSVGDATDHDGNPLRLSDQRSEGESAYIRLRDQFAGTAAAEEIRLGPEALEDILPNGRHRPARLQMSGGSDSVATMNDAMYQGADNDEPLLRTGIFALKNIQDISLVTVPGQTTVAVQQALIDHCEEDRYRFSVLDAQGPNRDSLNDVQNQRQQFDTRYASFYHPWLTIPEPMPENLINIRQVAIPPSGHMLGIYARTDIERGVHKAPANTVARGITGLTRSMNKGEQDILNPFPKNINVIRDFREDARGIRVWGARVITSDSDYKYINVRRLMIFLEASIDRGLQWVVFEPNAEELWARVRRTVTNFLTVVWRNGALEGTSPEQAFFVKCDRTTMTQTDIDNGRLICIIGVAPVKPAEFVIVRIGLWTANAQQ
jgi:phage tail sheath protein FI